MHHFINSITFILFIGCNTIDQTSQSQSEAAFLQRQITDKDLKSIGDLHLAVEEGDINAVRKCLEAGTDINCIRGKASFRVLHRAAELGDNDMVKYLIQKNADINAMAISGWTPLDLALREGHTLVVELLMHHGAKTGIELEGNR